MEISEPKVGCLVFYIDGHEFGTVVEIFENYLGCLVTGINWEGGTKSTDPITASYLKFFTEGTEKDRLHAILKYGS